MLSCGDSSEKREQDLQDLLSDHPCDNKLGSDLLFCQPNKVTNCTRADGKIDEGQLMQKGTYASTVAFVVLGLIFTLICQIFSVINVCHTPVEIIFGTHGLILWNAIASKFFKRKKTLIFFTKYF